MPPARLWAKSSRRFLNRIASAVANSTKPRACLMMAFIASGLSCNVLRNHNVSSTAGTLPRVSQPVIAQSMLLSFR
ncbi:hypothetical protein D3C72_1838280 [compost metagenome]